MLQNGGPGSNARKEERKLREEDAGGASGPGQEWAWWKGGLVLCILRGPLTRSVPQPETQLLKQAGEADSRASLAFSPDAGQTGQASPLFSMPLKRSHLERLTTPCLMWEPFPGGVSSQ